jgi:hypothetical protein
MQTAEKQELAPRSRSLGDGILNVIARAAADPNTSTWTSWSGCWRCRSASWHARPSRSSTRRCGGAGGDPARRKNKKNPDTKSKYADLEAVSDAIDPIMRAHGFSRRSAPQIARSRAITG